MAESMLGHSGGRETSKEADALNQVRNKGGLELR